MFDFEIARFLYRVAFLYENITDSPYKARAYFKAALAVDGYSKSIEALYQKGNIMQLPSIGSSIAKNIGEIINTHRLLLITELLGGIPETIFELYEFCSIKRRLLKQLIENSIYSIDGVRKLLVKNTISLSSGEIANLTDAVAEYDNRSFQYAHVYEIANDLGEQLINLKIASEFDLVGKLHAKNEIMPFGSIVCNTDLSVSALAEHLQCIDLFNVVNIGNGHIELKRFDIPFHLYLANANLYLTERNKLNRNFMPPRVLGNSKNVIRGIYGDLHMHTNWSDGLHSIEEMRNYAEGFGYEYIAITDHSQSLKPSGMSELDTLSQIKKIRELKCSDGVHVLSGIEVDILPDGNLDLPDSILKEFDIVIASVHSHFNQGLLTIERLTKAIRNPYVNVIGHPMGRLLGRPGKPTHQRAEMFIDFDYLLQLCKDNDVALELNCFPERFDLSLKNVIRTINAGVKISIGTDAHSMYHMDCTKYAIDFLRTAKLPKSYVLNCLKYDELLAYLKKGRSGNQFDASELTSQFKDFNHYFGSHLDIMNGKSKVVGIDLTGSENKASGFAVLSGVHAKTQPIMSDDEMVAEIVKVNPAVISIDSPLTLPKGRCCGRKDCECAKYGILRYCERLLRHFNIGVYPCLIDSMVNLTMRGMSLADRLKSMGYKVIESYPGVAQDLLHIPRKKSKKGNGYEPLISGLRNLGIEGIREGASHDEVDAITSALVGQFYLAGIYVGIGNEDEDYLIVPRLESVLSGRNLVIGLVGRIAAGKTTIAEYMRFKYGFDSMRFSQVISELYHVSGRDKLQRVGQEIAADGAKQKELSEFILHKMLPGRNYVIDGIRRNEDYTNLSAQLGNRFILVAVNANEKVRAKRYIIDNPQVTKDDFYIIDSHPVESSINSIELKSQFNIQNNKSYAALRNQIDDFVTMLSK